MSSIVEHCEYGILVKGQLSLSELSSLTMNWDSEGTVELVDLELGAELGGMAIVSSPADAKKWRASKRATSLKVIKTI